MSAPQSHKGIILVADDKRSQPRTTLCFAERRGLPGRLCSDGQQALARVNRDSMISRLLDVVMPRPTGFEVCQAMKSKPETRLIPVILLTSLKQ